MTDVQPIGRRARIAIRVPRAAILGFATFCVLVGCTPEAPPDAGKKAPPPDEAPVVAAPTPLPLVPAIHLVGSQFITGGGPGVERRAYIEIDGVIRPVFSGAREFVVQPECIPVPDEDGLVECTMTQPEKLTAEYSVVEAMPTSVSESPPHSEEHGTQSKGESVLRMITGPGHPNAKTEVLRLPAAMAGVFTRRFIHSLPQRAVLTPEVVLPGPARIRSWIGIEKETLGPDSPKVAFEVSVFRKDDDEPTRIFRTVLDPVRNPDHRGWVPIEFDLPEFGTDAFYILFETQRADPDDPTPTLPVWGNPTVLRPAEPHDGPKRVVLISLDTLRARSMSIYGNDRPTTPLFEKLLTEGTLFENAFTTFSNTLGSHMSMMTGLYPASHRVSAATRHLDRAIPTLAMGLRDAGYETAAFTENALLRADAGFQRGFVYYHENSGIEDGAGDAEGTFQRALDYAKTKPLSERLFLFVHTYEVHSPYEPPEYTDDELGPLVWEEAPGARAFTLRGQYEREIVHLDRLLADFLSELATIAPTDETLVVITSDHGEEFMEHGSILHLQLYDEVMKIPMFMRWPGQIPAGLRIETPVSLVDIVPTVLQIAGAPPTTTDGVSLVPVLEGAQIARNAVFGQSALSSTNQGRPQFVARAANAKCISREDEEGQHAIECFDLATDPLETAGRPPSDTPEFADLGAQLEGYVRRATRRLDGEAEEREIEAGDEIDPARREKLRVLGYIE